MTNDDMVEAVARAMFGEACLDNYATSKAQAAIATLRSRGWARRADVVEECAKVADEMSFGTDIGKWAEMTKREISANACEECADAIRALSTTTQDER